MSGKLTPEEWRALEDQASTVLDWQRELHALVYLQLRRGAGMSVDEAEKIVRDRRPE